MSAHHFAAIAKNTDRIATALEEMLGDSRQAREVDVEGLMTQALEALRATNPIFNEAFKQIEARIEAGEHV